MIKLFENFVNENKVDQKLKKAGFNIVPLGGGIELHGKNFPNDYFLSIADEDGEKIEDEKTEIYAELTDDEGMPVDDLVKFKNLDDFLKNWDKKIKV